MAQNPPSAPPSSSSHPKKDGQARRESDDEVRYDEEKREAEKDAAAMKSPCRWRDQEARHQGHDRRRRHRLTRGALRDPKISRHRREQARRQELRRDETENAKHHRKNRSPSGLLVRDRRSGVPSVVSARS